MLACLAAALAAVHAPAARRSAALEYGSGRSISVPDASDNGDGVTEDELECPNSHPTSVGGGAQISGHQQTLDLEIKSSAPGSQDTGEWRVQANNSSGSKASMVEHQICAKGNFVVVRKNGDPISSGDEGGALASCPRGTKLAGGGVATFGGDHATEVGDTEPADGNDNNSKRDDAWVAGVNNGSADTVNFKVTAVCAKRGTYKVVSSGPKRLPDNSQVSATARCPQGAQVTSGGVRITGTDSDLEVAQSFPFDSFDRAMCPTTAGAARRTTKAPANPKGWRPSRSARRRHPATPPDHPHPGTTGTRGTPTDGSTPKVARLGAERSDGQAY